MICKCGCKESFCLDDGTEICRKCGARSKKKSVSFIDPADYVIILGKGYWRNREMKLALGKRN